MSGDNTSQRLSDIVDRIASMGAAQAAAEVDALRATDPWLADALRSAIETLDAQPGDTPCDQDDFLARVVGRAAAEALEAAYDPPVLEPFGLSVLSLLGEGGSGMVYRAEQRNPHRNVAVKVVPAIRDGADKELFEAVVAARLSHPNVVTVFQCGRTETRSGKSVHFIAMELVEGVPISEHAEREALTFNGRIALLAELASIIAHAHASGITHGDLKPANILVDPAGQLRVLDFGVSSLRVHGMRHDGRAEGARPVTSRYTSPRRARERAAPSEEDDIYALGVLTVDLFAGISTSLARAATPDAWASRLSSVGMSRYQRAALAGVINRTLRAEPCGPYRSVGALAADLRSISSASPVPLSFDTPALSRQRLTQRALAAFPVAASLVVVAGLLVYAANLNTVLYRAQSAHEAGTQELISSRHDAARALDAIEQRAKRSELTTAAVSDILVRWSREMTRGDLQRAVALAEEIESGTGGASVNSWAVVTAAELLLDSGQHALCLERLSGLLEQRQSLTGTELAGVLRVAARASLLARDTERAKEYAHDLVGITTDTPSGPSAVLDADTRACDVSLLARAYAAANQPQRGLVTLDRYIDNTSLSPTARRQYLLAIASCQYMGGDMSDARDSLMRALSETSLSMGQDPREELEILSKLAIVQSELGQSEQAAATLEYVAARFEELLGPAHPRTVEVTYQLARAYLRLGALSRGIDVLERCLERLQSDEQLLIEAEINDALADAYESIGVPSKAAGYLRKLIEVRTALSGDAETEWVIMSEFRLLRVELAQSDHTTHDRVEGVRALRNLLTRAVAAGGATSPVTTTIYRELGYQIEHARAVGVDLQGLEQAITPLTVD